MKWIVFWVVVSSTPVFFQGMRDQYGFRHYDQVKFGTVIGKQVRDTMQEEFYDRASADAYVKELKSLWKPQWHMNGLTGYQDPYKQTDCWIDTVWMVEPETLGSVSDISDLLYTKGNHEVLRTIQLGTDKHRLTFTEPAAEQQSIFLTNKRKLVINGGVDTVIIEGCKPVIIIK